MKALQIFLSILFSSALTTGVLALYSSVVYKCTKYKPCYVPKGVNSTLWIIFFIVFPIGVLVIYRSFRKEDENR